MATMSFKKTIDDTRSAEPAEVVSEQQTSIVPASSPKKELSTLTNKAGDVVGEFGATDLRLPYLKIVQKISDDATRFGAGSVIFNGEVKIAGEGQPVKATFLDLHKVYEEKLPMDAQKRPMVFNTADEVLKAGGSFNPKDEHFFTEVACMRLVFERPEGLSEQDSLLFPYKAPNDNWYAMALWMARGTAYSQTGPVLYTASLNFLSDGLFQGEWAVSTEKRTNPKGSWHVPSLRYSGKHEGKMLDFMLSLRGNK